MNKTYAAYDADGGIQYTLRCSGIHADYEAEIGLSVTEVDDSVSGSEFYVAGGEVLPKQPLNLPGPLQVTADGIDEAVISGIPAGVTMTHAGESYEITDGTVEFATDLAGTYTLTFSAVAYLEQEVVIEAVPAT